MNTCTNCGGNLDSGYNCTFCGQSNQPVRTLTGDDAETQDAPASQLKRWLYGDKIYVLAGRYDEVINFSHENEINKNKLKYLTNAESVLGIRNGYYIKIGTWYEKENCYDMEEILKAANCTDVTDKIT